MDLGLGLGLGPEVVVEAAQHWLIEVGSELTQAQAQVMVMDVDIPEVERILHRSILLVRVHHRRGNRLSMSAVEIEAARVLNQRHQDS